ncbi:DNA cytosine methyltransferase, partial [Allomuricauda sp. MMSF_3543]
SIQNLKIPVIDIFAGPGGLGEGFSSVWENEKKVFDIKLSIEKEENAHKTLLFRSFFRQFAKNELPDAYYDVLKEENLGKREEKMKDLFDAYPKEYRIASAETWKAELGSEKFPEDLIDQRIQNGIDKNRDWVLIGGPPCQAYSLAGRSRVGGIDKSDHRVYLYRQYLRIIAKFHPKVFVMENVKGLLSAKVGKESVFDWIKRDLNDPSKLFPEFDSPTYKVYSLSTAPETFSINGNPIYAKDSDFLIKSEEFGVPQKRHRVILLGIRQDLEEEPGVLTKCEAPIKLKAVIGDLPKIRSGLNRKFVRSYTASGKKKRVYEKVNDDFDTWHHLVSGYKYMIQSWNGFEKSKQHQEIGALDIGSEFVPCKTPSSKNPLYTWYMDPKLNGACNHISRSHLTQDLMRYQFSSLYAEKHKRFPRLNEYTQHSSELMPDHKSADTGKFADRFRVQLPDEPATTVTSHISKDGHYFIHYDSDQCRSLTVREAARIQTFPDNYLFCGSRTAQFHQVGNAVPPYLAYQIANIVKKLVQ